MQSGVKQSAMPRSIISLWKSWKGLKGADDNSHPASLILLIRERLCGSNPDLHQSYLTRERFRQAVFNAGLNFPQTGKPISIRKLAAAAGVSRATAARWRAHEDFPRLFEWGRSYAASEDFVQLKETIEKRYALGREPAAAKEEPPSEAARRQRCR